MAAMTAAVGGRGVAVVLAVAALAGCAGRQPRQAQAPAPAPVVAVSVSAPVDAPDALGNYRFLMQDGEQKMTADQFDAWMRANGIRVAKGAPAAVPATADKL